MIDFYGIPGCDTVKKARTWLDQRGIEYTFHDYKKEGADPSRLRQWVAAKGWEAVLNRRGTTFRQLAESEKADLEAGKYYINIHTAANKGGEVRAQLAK